MRTGTARARLLLFLGAGAYLLAGAAADVSGQSGGSLTDAGTRSGAEWPLAERVDAVFEGLAGADAPGCAAGVVEDGELVHARGYGAANLDYGIPLDGRSVFYLASVSKQFTAAAVLLASEQGHLTLDDEVRRWIPELPDYGSPLTIRHLVHHTSGLRDYLTLMSLAGRAYGDAFDDEAMLGLISRQRALNFDPGSEYLYSNSGYVLLAEIVGRATGRSLREYADEELFQPLGMTDTHFHDDAAQVVPRRVVSYSRAGEDRFRVSYLAAFDRIGDGGLYSTIEDLGKWSGALMDGRIGPPGFTDRLQERGVLNDGDTLSYAFGLTLGSHRGVREVSHGGSMMGFRTSLRLFPEERVATIVLCNLNQINPTGLATQVAEMVLDDRLAPPREPRGRAATSAEESGAEQGDSAVDRLPDPVELAVYAGTFRSDELEAEYRIAVDADGLALTNASGRTVSLRPAGPDRFTTPQGQTVRFTRGDSDAVSGFALDAGRVRGIEFVRDGFVRDGPRASPPA